MISTNKYRVCIITTTFYKETQKLGRIFECQGNPTVVETLDRKEHYLSGYIANKYSNVSKEYLPLMSNFSLTFKRMLDCINAVLLYHQNSVPSIFNQLAKLRLIVAENFV